MSIAEAPAVDRFKRQADLVPRNRLLKVNCLVIGVGAIGRQLALMLAAIGVRRLQLVDFDKVDHTNVTTQGYSYQVIGDLKVDVTATEIRNRFADVQVNPVCDEFRPKYLGAPAVFCCVDSMAARSSIWQDAQREVQFWGDTRMLGETLRILTATPLKDGSFQAYDRSLFHDDQAEPGRCTAVSTIYTASIAAGMLIHQFSRWLRDQETDDDLIMNLPANLLEPMAADGS